MRVTASVPMRVDFGEVLQKVLRFLHLTPLSLAAKCRIMFGAGVLFSLVIALLIPYTWMRQLTRKDLLDMNKARAESILLRSHFRLEPSGDIALPALDEYLPLAVDGKLRWVIKLTITATSNV